MSLEQLSKTVDFVQDATPSNANDGETYLDTSLSPPRLKVFDSSVGGFIEPRSIQNLDAPVSGAGATQTDIETGVDNSNTGATVSSNLDAPVSQAGASAEVKRLDLRFVREMSRLFFDRSLAALNFSEGTFEIFADRNNITTSSTVVVLPGANGQAFIGTDFNIGTASFTGTTTNTQDGNPRGVTFSADGTTMIEIGSNSSQFYEYSLGTAFDISTANFTGTTLNTQDSTPRGVTFSADGTTMIEVGSSSGQFYEYSLGTAFDISTANFTGTTLNTQVITPTGVTFSADGTTMIEIGQSPDQFSEYSLTTAFDIGSANFTNTTLNTQDGQPRGVAFSADGTTMIEIGESSDQFYEYSLNTAFDISSANFTNTTLNTQDSAPQDVTFSADGTTMIEIGNSSNLFYEYGGLSAETTGTGTVSKSVTLAFTPTTAVVEDTRENGLNASYDISDGNGNTVSVSQTEVGTTVDCSALTDGSLTVTANLDNPTTAANALRDFAVYFD